MNEPEHGLYDDTTKRFYNGKTRKWVKRLRPSGKGKFVGLTKGDAYLKKYNEAGNPQKYLQIPVNADIELIKSEASERALNYEYCLFILHKLLYNRIRSRKTQRDNQNYYNNFTPLSSTDILKWIGNDYTKYIRLLVDVKYIFPKLSDNGNLSYWNGNKLSNQNRQTGSYKINPELFSNDLFEFKAKFKSVPLGDIKLTVKLHERGLKNNTENETVSILRYALKNVRLYQNTHYLNRHFLPEISEEVSILINDINNGDIYVKDELDSYGERFHSTFTFTWASLRPLIYFKGSNSDLIYLDLSNSQYFFFTLLIYEYTYKELIPEYFDLGEIVNEFSGDDSFKTFAFHAQNATLYSYVESTYGLKKKDLMKVFFAKSTQYKKIRSQKFPWLQSILEKIEVKFERNILPEVLQRLESRNLLGLVCKPFLQRNKEANLISIHDGLLFEAEFFYEIATQLTLAFSHNCLPVPKFKTVRYQNPLFNEADFSG